MREKFLSRIRNTAAEVLISRLPDLL
jgi:hypothetical protein